MRTRRSTPSPLTNDGTGNGRFDRRSHRPAEDGHRLGGLAELASDPPQDAIERILTVAREQLHMDVAFVGEFTQGKEVFRATEGDAESFGIRKDAGVRLEDTYCHRVADCRLPNIITDAKNDERVNRLEATQAGGIGAYIGVPLRFSDGSLYGTLCCLSHEADPSLTQRDTGFMHVLARLMADQLERQDLERKNARLEVQATAAKALLAVLEARDGYTGEHSEAVVDLSTAVGRQLDLDEGQITEVGQVALLHDVGKVAVPDSVLKKAGPLDPPEWETMKNHPVAGAHIVASIDGLAHLAPAIRAEHERWDGTGYPDRLTGEDIPLTSRIVFACDAYHAMTSNRPYRKAMTKRQAIRELQQNAGRQFCPSIVDALLSVLCTDVARRREGD
jgi:response regulator RpfG family c-di-GMP phosphodiesterase